MVLGPRDLRALETEAILCRSGGSFLRASKARAFGEGVQAQVDGEIIGRLPMAFSISPHSIEVVVTK